MFKTSNPPFLWMRACLSSPAVIELLLRNVPNGATVHARDNSDKCFPATNLFPAHQLIEPPLSPHSHAHQLVLRTSGTSQSNQPPTASGVSRDLSKGRDRRAVEPTTSSKALSWRFSQRVLDWNRVVNFLIRQATPSRSQMIFTAADWLCFAFWNCFVPKTC